MANLVLAINGTWTPWVDTYIEVSDANRAKLKNAWISASYASHVLTITTQWYVTVAETSTVWAWGTPVASCWFGQYWCTDLVIQSDVKVQQNKEPLMTGYNYLCWTLYGKKTFTEWANRGIKVDILS
jgi:hypothetical protein